MKKKKKKKGKKGLFCQNINFVKFALQGQQIVMSAHAEMTFLQLLYYVLIAGMKEHVGGLGAELLICEGLRD